MAKGRKKTYDSTIQVSFRLDELTFKFLQKYNVNLNAQVNHYLGNLCLHLALNDNSVFVYTK